jgi:hypothetical protein
MNRKEIIEICHDHRITNYTIKEDDQGFYVDVMGDVFIRYKFSHLPLRFGYVHGTFQCSFIGLTSLVGCPRQVGGNFNCSNNRLTSLEGCPILVDGLFGCNGNPNLNKHSYNQLFELGYDTDYILTEVDIVSIKRQWIIKGIINE